MLFPNKAIPISSPHIMQTSIDGFNPCSGCNLMPSFIFFPPLFLMLCEIAGIEPTYRTMNPIKQVLRSSQTGALCLKHKKINEEIFLTYAIASKIAISTISMTNIIENILNAFSYRYLLLLYVYSSSIQDLSGRNILCTYTNTNTVL